MTRRSGVCEKRPTGGIRRSQTFARGDSAKRVVPAGIQHTTDIDGLRSLVARLARPGIHRHHEVVLIDLQAMACVVQHAYPLFAFQHIAHRDEGRRHLRLVAIAQLDDSEAEPTQRIAHGFGIVGRVQQGGAPV